LRAWLIIGLLAVCVGNPVPKQQSDPQKHQEVAKQSPAPPPIPVGGASSQSQPPAAVKENSSDKKTERIWQKAFSPQSWSTWALVIVGVGAIFVALCTLQAIHRQANIMERQIAAMERPWIAVNVSVASPLQFNRKDRKGNAGLNFTFSLKNVGHSVAVGVNAEAKIIAWKDDLAQPIKRQRNFCDEVRQSMVDPSERGITLFPDEQTVQIIGFEISSVDVESAVLPFKGTEGKYFSPVLVGCVDYQFSHSPTHHQTRFIYQIQRRNSDQPFRPLRIEVGKDLPVSDVVLTRWFFGGDYAD